MSRPVLKTWLQAPEFDKRPESVTIIGAGIAGATTAHALAQRGIAVTVLEAHEPAHGASGNHQGLLYAKLTAANTTQNQLLRLALPFALQHLQHYFPERDFWDDCGLLQLAFDAAEQQRQQKLLQQRPEHIAAWAGQHPHSPWQAHTGLWWSQSAWVSPPLWIQALLNHPNIQLKRQQKVQDLVWQDSKWHIQTNHGCLQATHVIVCAGHLSNQLPPTKAFALRAIRGQVAYAPSHPNMPIEHAVSGQHYLIPAFENCHTFGASFVLNDTDTSFRVAEHQHNLDGLQQLLPEFAAHCASQKMQGRASIRADSIDHLPILGPVGNFAAMQHTYAKLSQDKRYPIDAKCPYQPNLWLNTAHGTRGMLTAPLCAESLARRLCQETDVLPEVLQDALHPNRLPIRQLIYGIC